MIEEFWQLYFRLQKMFGLSYATGQNSREVYLRIYYANSELFSVSLKPDHYLDIRNPSDLAEGEELKERVYARAKDKLKSWADKKFEEMNINYKL